MRFWSSGESVRDGYMMDDENIIENQNQTKDLQILYDNDVRRNNNNRKKLNNVYCLASEFKI